MINTWENLIITAVGIAGYFASAYVFKRLMGRKELSGFDLFWIAFAYLILVGEFWQ